MSYPLELEPTILNFVAEKGSTFKRTIVWTDDNDVPINNSKMTATFKVRDIVPATYRTAASVGSALVSLTSGSGITLGGSNGQIAIVIPSATTANLVPGSYFYNLTLNVEGVARLTGASSMYFSTPDSVPNSITSDIDIRAKVRLNDWTPAATNIIVAKWATSNFSYALGVNTSGGLTLELSQAGSVGTSASSSIPISVTNRTDKWVRATWRNSDDRVQFFTSDDGVTWTQLGSDQSIAITGIFNGTAALLVGKRDTTTSEQLSGIVYYAEVRSGIDGTVAATFDPKTYSGSGTTWVAAGTGETWTIVGSPVIMDKECVIFKGMFEVLPEATY